MTGKTRDKDVRELLYKQEFPQFLHDGESRVIEEFAVDSGESRIDIAIINGSLHGYEIKSDVDTFARLPSQVASYGKVFDFLWLVVGAKWVNQAEDELPPWWGILTVKPGTELLLERSRVATHNPNVDASSVAGLLWKSEAFMLMNSLGKDRPSSRASRSELTAYLAMACSLDQLRKEVRAQLRARASWRSGASPFRDGGLPRSVSTSSRCRANLDWLLSQRSPDLRS